MAKKIDLTGQQFSDLLVLGFYGKTQRGVSLWECICSCGNTKIVAGSNLKRGHTQSCGCRRNAEDITGRKYGLLRVICRQGSSVNRNSLWKCECDCGNTKLVTSNALKFGYVKSCGCLNSTDLTGQKFGRLLVIKQTHIDNRSGTFWICKCDCGNVVTVRRDALTSGGTQSCGCLNIEISSSHKKSHTRLYSIFAGMKGRCYNPNNTNYKHYGQRGICICKEWLNNFTAFYEWSVNNGYSDDLSIDRIDVNGNYEPSNCRWADAVTQANNKRNSRKKVSYE